MKFRMTSSYFVWTRRDRVPELIEFMYLRALVLDFNIRADSLSPGIRERMKEEWHKRVATLMLLDEYSATHPFDKGEVEIESTPIPNAEIRSWWDRYKKFGPAELVDRIWAEVDL